MELLAGTEILEGVYVMEVTGGWGREGGWGGGLYLNATLSPMRIIL